ncbi:hypothetical protein AAVH_23543 [Aphelenchoides avenae]|nr:hypothetical protein AAVH_23543 [Aphelenchus avenae]
MSLARLGHPAMQPFHLAVATAACHTCPPGYRLIAYESAGGYPPMFDTRVPREPSNAMLESAFARLINQATTAVCIVGVIAAVLLICLSALIVWCLYIQVMKRTKEKVRYRKEIEGKVYGEMDRLRRQLKALNATSCRAEEENVRLKSMLGKAEIDYNDLSNLHGTLKSRYDAIKRRLEEEKASKDSMHVDRQKELNEALKRAETAEERLEKATSRCYSLSQRCATGK